MLFDRADGQVRAGRAATPGTRVAAAWRLCTLWVVFGCNPRIPLRHAPPPTHTHTADSLSPQLASAAARRLQSEDGHAGGASQAT